MKNLRTGGGYLHSHFALYPDEEGALQQQVSIGPHYAAFISTVVLFIWDKVFSLLFQVTTYHFKDVNNVWFVRKQSGAECKNSLFVYLEETPSKLQGIKI